VAWLPVNRTTIDLALPRIPLCRTQHHRRTVLVLDRTVLELVDVAMQAGDTVMIKSTGRRALITAGLPQGHFQVDYLPDPASDPIDRDSPPPVDECGVYVADELEPITA